MDTREQIPNSEKLLERQIFDALKHYGYKVPRSQEEIDKYVRMFGNTKVELPNSLMDAGALFDSAVNNEALPNEINEIEGMAARGDNTDVLPEYIVEKIKEDFKDGKWLK